MVYGATAMLMTSSCISSQHQTGHTKLLQTGHNENRAHGCRSQGAASEVWGIFPLMWIVVPSLHPLSPDLEPGCHPFSISHHIHNQVYLLKKISRLQTSLSKPVFESLIHTFISFHLDYGNSLLFGLSIRPEIACSTFKSLLLVTHTRRWQASSLASSKILYLLLLHAFKST